jgi:hypothetical protein
VICISTPLYLKYITSFKPKCGRVGWSNHWPEFDHPSLPSLIAIKLHQLYNFVVWRVSDSSLSCQSCVTFLEWMNELNHLLQFTTLRPEEWQCRDEVGVLILYMKNWVVLSHFIILCVVLFAGVADGMHVADYTLRYALAVEQACWNNHI